MENKLLRLLMLPIKVVVFINDKFDVFITRRDMEYSIVITNMPDSSFDILSFVCRRAVITPAEAPEKKPALKATHSGAPFNISIPPTDAPSINEPSGVKSGNPITLNAKHTDIAGIE